MDTIFGGLVQFESREQFNNFVETINDENAIKLIEMALLFSLKNGLFSFEESHIIYECLNKLKSKQQDVKEN
jgi:hypothetical protein